MTELLKKMSPKTIMGKAIEVPEDSTLLYTIFGIASGVRSGESTYGPWSSLVGQFEAIRTEDGAVFQGAQCFLPDPVHGMIVERLREGEVESLDFAVNVTVKPEPKSATGYEYIAELISDAQENDPLAALRKRAIPALAAPEETGEEEVKYPAQRKAKVPVKKSVPRKGVQNT